MPPPPASAAANASTSAETGTGSIHQTSLSPLRTAQVADSLLGSKAAEGSAAADDAAALPLAGNSTRVEGLLARVRGNRFSNGLRFKEDVIDVIDSAYAYTPTEYRSGFDTPWEVVNPAGKNEGCALGL